MKITESLGRLVRRVPLVALLISMMGMAAPFGAGVSHAATQPLGLTNVAIRVNPEYDDAAGLGVPSVLVMIDGQIVGTTVPATVRFRVPSDAVLNSAGSGPRAQYARGDNLVVPTPSAPGGWSEVSFDIKTQYFVVEYYQPITLAGTTRNISYDFRPEYPVDKLSVSVEEPTGSSGYTVTPLGTVQGVTGTDIDGLKNHTYPFNNVDPSATPPTVHFDISYTKSNTTPSFGKLGGGTTTPVSGPNTAAIVLIVLGGLAVLAVLFVLLRSKFSPSRPSHRTNVPRKGSTARLNQQAGGKQASAGKAGAKFCPSCGQPVEPNAQFCPYCGNKLRS